MPVEISPEASCFGKMAAEPSLVMLMSGCYDVFINQMVMDAFPHGGWPSERLVSGEREYALALRERLPDFASKIHRDKYALCACERLSAVIALTKRHCTFENLFSELKAAQWEGERSALAFLGRRERDSERLYSVYQVTCQRTALEFQDSLAPTFLVLHTRLKPVHLEVRLRSMDDSLRSKSRSRPQEMNCAVWTSDAIWMKDEVFTVPRVVGYEEIDKRLKSALKMLQSGSSSVDIEKWLLDEITVMKEEEGQRKREELANELDYSALNGVIHHLCHGRKPGELRNAIEETRRFLFDVLVLDQLRPSIQSRMIHKMSLTNLKAATSVIQSVQKYGTLPLKHVERPVAEKMSSSPAGFAEEKDESFRHPVRKDVMQEEADEENQEWSRFVSELSGIEEGMFDNSQVVSNVEERLRVFESLLNVCSSCSSQNKVDIPKIINKVYEDCSESK